MKLQLCTKRCVNANILITYGFSFIFKLLKGLYPPCFILLISSLCMKYACFIQRCLSIQTHPPKYPEIKSLPTLSTFSKLMEGTHSCSLQRAHFKKLERSP